MTGISIENQTIKRKKERFLIRKTQTNRLLNDIKLPANKLWD